MMWDNQFSMVDTITVLQVQKCYFFLLKTLSWSHAFLHALNMFSKSNIFSAWLLYQNIMKLYNICYYQLHLILQGLPTHITMVSPCSPLTLDNMQLWAWHCSNYLLRVPRHRQRRNPFHFFTVEMKMEFMIFRISVIGRTNWSCNNSNVSANSWFSSCSTGSCSCQCDPTTAAVADCSCNCSTHQHHQQCCSCCCSSGKDRIIYHLQVYVICSLYSLLFKICPRINYEGIQ